MTLDQTNNRNRDHELRLKLAEADLYKQHGLTNEAYFLFEGILQEIGINNTNHPLHKHVERRFNELKETEEWGIPLSSRQVSSECPEDKKEKQLYENCQGLIATGFHEEAEEQLFSLLKSNYTPWLVHASLGNNYLIQNKIAKALDHLKTASDNPAARHQTQWLEILDQLALAYERAGAIPEAIKTMQRVVSLDPEFNRINIRLQELIAADNRDGYLLNLLNENQLTSEQIKNAREASAKQRRSIEKILTSDFGINKEIIGKALSNYYQLPFVEFDPDQYYKTPAKIIGFNDIFFKINRFIPFKEEDNVLIIATNNPADSHIKNAIVSDLKIIDFRFVVTLEEDINKFISSLFTKQEHQEKHTDEETDTEVEEFINNEDLFDFSNELELIDDDDNEEDDTQGDSDSIVVQLVNKVVEDAFSQGASDVHIETVDKKEGIHIRFRIDGDCKLYRKIPYQYRRSFVSRIKILAKLDISERRLPQDGKIKLISRRGNKIELRVATMPTIGGNEDTILRILARGSALTLGQMGFQSDMLSDIKSILDHPYGLMLVVGPTGSGKTTTLHAALNHLNIPEKKIWTAEDPVEIVQKGLRQVQVKPLIGLTFAHILKSFLRADPDIIMVGELRDKETAKIAVEASMTGHLVLSTLHTNSAPETITRLLGMGIEPYNFADSLLGVLAQRLLRRICPDCRQELSLSEEETISLRTYYGTHPHDTFAPENIEFRVVYDKGAGCPSCKMSGYIGRCAAHELLTVSDELKTMIIDKSPASEITMSAKKNGMLTLRQDSILKIIKGITSLQQVKRICG